MGISMYIGLCCLGILTTSPFFGAQAASCNRGWLQKQGNCYGYFDETMDWDTAELECQSYGPGCHLASILSPQESALVSAYVKDKQESVNNVWMGLRDISGKKRWRWADESTYNYKTWTAGQPDNYYLNEYCVQVTSDSSFKEWSDMSCSTLNAYICKYQL